MSGNQKRRREARERRGEVDDPFQNPAFWEAWHNPPCPEVESVHVEAVTRCVTYETLEDDDLSRLQVVPFIAAPPEDPAGDW